MEFSDLLCIHVHVRGGGLVFVHIYTHAKVQGYCQLSYSISTHLRFLKQCLSLNLQLLVLTRIIGQDLSVSIPSTRFIEIKSNNQILCRYWGFELSSSCFQYKSSYYLSHSTLCPQFLGHVQ